jgi:fructose-1,6-bisphosphatase I
MTNPHSTISTTPQLDLLSDEIMIDALVKSGTCALLVSEEQEEPIVVSGQTQSEKSFI